MTKKVAVPVHEVEFTKDSVYVMTYTDNVLWRHGLIVLNDFSEIDPAHHWVDQKWLREDPAGYWQHLRDRTEYEWLMCNCGLCAKARRTH